MARFPLAVTLRAVPRLWGRSAGSAAPGAMGPANLHEAGICSGLFGLCPAQSMQQSLDRLLPIGRILRVCPQFLQLRLLENLLDDALRLLDQGGLRKLLAH